MGGKEKESEMPKLGKREKGKTGGRRKNSFTRVVNTREVQKKARTGESIRFV